jgi:glycosyltransferase involved in cell wall biosynthesis
MKILIITKSRSGYGSHVVLTSIIRQLRTAGHNVEILVSEHKLEWQKWQKTSQKLWDSVSPTILDFNKSRITEHDPKLRPYAYTDDVLLHDENLINKLKSINTSNYNLVLLDSWYLACSAFICGLHLNGNVYQFVQSEPVFEPTVRADEWKALIFKLLPWVSAKRIFVSESLAQKFNMQYQQKHKAIGFFIDNAFLKTKHKPREIKQNDRLEVVSMASNFNIPTKGLEDLLLGLTKLNQQQPLSLKLICTIPITKNFGVNFPVKIVRDANTAERRAKELANADLYVTCTVNESPGLAQAEAIAAGLPSVAIDSNGNRDYYCGENFLMAANSSELNKHLLAMLDYDTRKRISKNAKISMQSYSIDSCVKRLLSYAK